MKKIQFYLCGLSLGFGLFIGHGQAEATGVPDKIGVYQQGNWYLDQNANGAWEAGSDFSAAFGDAEMLPVFGDWNGDGFKETGAYLAGTWYFDLNANRQWDGEPTDRMVTSFVIDPGDIPVVGDWSGVGRIKIGVYRPSTFVWYLDYDGDYIYNPTIDGDKAFGFPGAIPVVGDWNGDGRDKIGVFYDGQWYLDKNGTFRWDGSTVDTLVASFGSAGMLPVVGDWTGSGVDRIGTYHDGNWYLDTDGNGIWNPTLDQQLGPFGGSGMVPVVGRNYNVIPVANAGPDQALGTNAQVTLTGGSSDLNFDPLSYSWSFISLPVGSNAVLTGATTLTPWFTADLKGTYIASLVVSDGSSNSVEDTVTIEVTSPYTVNGDGTSSDASSGLMWQQMDDNVNRTFSPANTYCVDLTLANYTDWRLPTLNELLGLLRGAACPRADVAAFPGTNCTSYWTSTPNGSNISVVNFSTGTIGYAMPNVASIPTRCVRP